MLAKEASEKLAVLVAARDSRTKVFLDPGGSGGAAKNCDNMSQTLKIAGY